MQTLTGILVSVHAGSRDDLSKPEQASVEVQLDGFAGDAHRGYTRKCWDGDKQAKGTVRRNERQWSAVSVEELEEISSQMDLVEALSAECLGANLCIRGIPGLSRLPKGTVLKFQSGVELLVEEYNPPCHDMGKKIASMYKRNSGVKISGTDFSKTAKLLRGVVGVIETGGVLSAGDEVAVTIFEHPSWLGG